MFKPKRYFDVKVAKEMLSFAGCAFLTTLTSALSVYGGNLVINNFFGTSINAAQGVASQISGQLMVFPNNFLMAINPVIGKSAGAKDYGSMIKYALTSSKLSFLILLFFAVPFIIEANWIMKIWLKNVPEWAVIFCQLEVVRRLFDQLLVGIHNSINAEGHIKRYSMTQSVLYVMPLPICIVLFSLGYSPVWLYICWILFLNVFASYNAILQAYRYCHLCRKDFFTLLVFRCFLVALIMVGAGLIPHYLISNPIIRFMTVGLFTSLTFIVSVWYIAFTLDEKRIAVSAIRQIKTKVLLKRHLSNT